MQRLRRLLDDDISIDRAWQELNDHRKATPPVVVEAIWHSIRERGLGALDEAVNRRRLSECDSAACAELSAKA